MECKLCKKEYKGTGFSNHIRNHGLNTKDYYDKYLKIESENICNLPDCLNEVSFISINKGYRKFCSDTCGCKSDNHRKAVKERFVDNKAKKELADKRRFETVTKNHGKDFYKKHCTDMNKKFSSEELSNRTKLIWAKRTDEERSEIGRKIVLGQSKTNHYKEYVLNNEKVKVQGYEPQVLDFLKTILKESDITVGVKSVPIIDYNHGDGSKHKYYPDIYLKDRNLLIEVKSEWTFEQNKEINLLKQKAAEQHGYEFIFVLYNNRTKKGRKASLEGLKNVLIGQSAAKPLSQ